MGVNWILSLLSVVGCFIGQFSAVSAAKMVRIGFDNTQAEDYNQLDMRRMWGADVLAKGFQHRAEDQSAPIFMFYQYNMHTKRQLASCPWASRPFVGGPLAPRRSRVLGIVLLSILLLVSLISAGCGGTAANGGEDDAPAEPMASLIQIAADYARDGNLDQAQAALSQLDLANPAQLLVTVAEQAVNEGRPRGEIEPLARLADALNLRSPKLLAYLAPTSPPSPQPPSPTTAPPSPTAAPTDEPVPATPTATAMPPTATPSPTPQQSRVLAGGTINLRSGPGTNYPVIGQLQTGQEVLIAGRNESGDWWKLTWDSQGQAWVAGIVVSVLGPIDTVAVAADIPAPPPTNTSAPPPEPTAPPKPAGPDFRLVEKRLWGPEENGGHFDGPSFHCGLGRELHVYVLDAAGNRLNGVTVKAVYGNKEEIVTGGKGPGEAEFVLGGGQDTYIIRDVDGREVTSDYARGLTTDPAAIPLETLLQTGYCPNIEECQRFVAANSCWAHYSWSATFQRAY